MSAERRFSNKIQIVDDDATPLARQLKTDMLRSLAEKKKVVSAGHEVTASGRVLDGNGNPTLSSANLSSGQDTEHTLKRFEPGNDPRLPITP